MRQYETYIEVQDGQGRITDIRPENYDNDMQSMRDAAMKIAALVAENGSKVRLRLITIERETLLSTF